MKSLNQVPFLQLQERLFCGNHSWPGNMADFYGNAISRRLCRTALALVLVRLEASQLLGDDVSREQAHLPGTCDLLAADLPVQEPLIIYRGIESSIGRR